MIAGDILGERARLTPDKLALVYPPTGECFTFAQLDDRSRKCALLWTKVAGQIKGDRVGILAHNCVEYIDAFFAAAKSGIIIVPLNSRLTAGELEGIVRDSGVCALMYERQFSDVVSALSTATKLDCCIVLDGPNQDHLDYRALMHDLNGAEWRNFACAPEDIHCLLYTSGTTGKPKGVMVPHRMVLWNAYNTTMCWQLREDDVSPIFTPLCHAGGLTVFLTALFAIGGTIVLHRGFDAAEIWRTIQVERCTVVMGVPTIYKLLMEAPEFEKVSLDSVRWFISGGAPLPLYIIKAYQRRGVTLKQGYGLTEVGVNCFTMTAADSCVKLGSIGKPMMFTEARLLANDGSAANGDETGELCLRGPHVCRGYWNSPEPTSAALDADGWFHTGDLARCDEDGFFYIVGRAKDMLISGGINVYPAEIEAELVLHPDVKDAAVVGVPHDTWGEIGVAFVVQREGAMLTSDGLAKFLSERLAKFKVPRDFVFIENLPRTPYGKVIKRELQEQYVREKAGA